MVRTTVMKEFVEEHVAPKKIHHIQFGLLSGVDMEKLSELQVVNRELYRHPERVPMPHGCLDFKMGVSDKNNSCETCGQKIADCIGHFGYVKLELPVFHAGYIRQLLQILNMICKNCCRVLLPEAERKTFLNTMRNSKYTSLQRQAILKRIIDRCKKNQLCCRCGNPNGTVKKVGLLRIVHDKYKSNTAKKEEITREFHEQFDEAVKFNPDMKAFLNKAQEDLNPLVVLHLLQRIPDEDCELMDIDLKAGRPERLIVTHLLVPPVCIRPSVNMDSSGSNEDDITMKLSEIVHINSSIKSLVDKGATMQMLMEAWEYLQVECAMLINSEMPGLVQGNQGGKPIRSFCQRLKGKAGRFRGNLSGKRVDFSGRTVISPDPNLRIDEVAVPELVAKILTYPERVTPHNLAKMKKIVANGNEVWPGATFIKFPDGTKRFLPTRMGASKAFANALKVGDVVERHLLDGDLVLFNRQPSLHRVSIMCHKAKIRPWKTFRFNECVCTPYNADFDGDEMNLHVPQTEEARAEALELMGVTQNLITPRNGEPLIAATQDFITASYLITRKDTFLDRAKFCNLVAGAFDAEGTIDLPPPAIRKPMELWTGKQAFTVLIRRMVSSPYLINVELASKSYVKDEIMCPKDGYVCFRNSELMCGVLDKASLGSGGKSNIFHVIMRDYTPQEAASCMSRLAKMCARFITNWGFSIGISDVQPSAEVIKEQNELMRIGYEKCASLIEDYKNGKLPPQAGCNAEQTLEVTVNGVLSKIRDQAGELCLKKLHRLNSPLIMAVCGSKGSTINISQMISCVGQQTVSGSRIPDGFLHRTLPHFELHSREPAAKGFVKNSFYSGLSPTEFFFHTMGGREGLVDTAVKTAETGYMQRRLMKALEDLSVQYDDTVRNSTGDIVQFIYGDDGLDPAGMEAQQRPVDFKRLINHSRNVIPAANDIRLLPGDISRIVEQHLSSKDFELCSDMFKEEVRTFWNKFSEVLVGYRQSFGFPTTLKSTYEEEKILIHKSPAEAKAVDNLQQITEKQLRFFLETCRKKYHRARVEPGTAVGALGAQSIGEPGTQMTLKTFHFAGVASMNVTLGVPRIKEIINASKKINTPIITANLVVNNDIKVARIVKGRIEKTTLGEIAEYFEEVITSQQYYLKVKLDMKAIEALQLEVTAESIKNSILNHKKLKLKEKHIIREGPDKLLVYPIDPIREKMYYNLQHLKNSLPSVVVKGIETINRAVISEADNGTYQLLVEGNELLRVMATPGVKGPETIANHIIVVQSTLGIEAARKTIIDEIQETMKKHGMTIDVRHVMLLADVMSCKGEILGIQRFGIAKMKDSVLMLASFEKTTDHLFEAAVRGRKEFIDGVSECIIMGVPVPLGTGLFKLLHKTPQVNFLRRKLLLDAPEMNVKL